MDLQRQNLHDNSAEYQNPAYERTVDGLAQYVRTIENCFVEIRGRGVQWSPSDAARAASWHGAGLPATAAIRVLQARIQAWQFQHGNQARLPMHLSWYEPAIFAQCRHLRRHGCLEQIAETQEVPEGSAGSPLPAPPSLCDLVLAGQHLAAATEHPGKTRAYAHAAAQLDRALRPDASDQPPQELDPEQTDALIDRTRTQMVKTLLAALDEQQDLALQGFLQASLGALQGQLSRRTLAARRQAMTECWLSSQLGVHWPTTGGWQEAGQTGPKGQAGP